MFSVILVLGKWFPHHFVCLLSLEKRGARKRLSDKQAKDDAALQPAVTGTLRPSVVVDLCPPKVPLIQPKTEPEEQESKWTNPYNMLFTCFSFLKDTQMSNLIVCFFFSLCS